MNDWQRGENCDKQRQHSSELRQRCNGRRYDGNGDAAKATTARSERLHDSAASRRSAQPHRIADNQRSVWIHGKFSVLAWLRPNSSLATTGKEMKCQSTRIALQVVATGAGLV